MKIYNYLDKNIKGINSQELLSLVEHVDVPLKEYNVLPADASMIAVHGVLRGNQNLIQQAVERQVPWMYMDNAGHYFPDMYKRVVLNATAPITFRGGKRFEHNIKLERWRGGQGSKIIVLPPSPPYMDTFGCRDFLNHIAHNVNLYTDKEIVIRAKPAKGRKAPSWDEQLADAYCVITWGSALALDAMIKGVPTISLGWCPAKNVSAQLHDLETSLLTHEPARMDTLNNLTWCSFKREELPLAYEIALENSKYLPL